MVNLEQGRLAMPVHEAARQLGVSRSAVYAAIHSGEIPSVRIGGRILVPYARLQEIVGRSAGGRGTASGGDLRHD